MQRVKNMKKLSKKHIIVCIGPTASGKTAAAIDFAQAENGVIINADSMQIYDALPILTARPTPEEQAAAPHRLYAALHPADRCTAPRWREMAIKEIEACFEAGQMPILVGGTGFYIKSLMEGLSPIPEVPAEIHERGLALHKERGNEWLYAEMQSKDPVMAERLEANDYQRLLRAWEVIEATGKSLAEWQKLPKTPPPEGWEFEVRPILRPREEIYDRINKRLELMVEEGALDEVQELADMIDRGEVAEDAAIVVAHGFRLFRRYLRGEVSLEEAVEHTKMESRHYAKRQMTWLRQQLGVDVPRMGA
jgi:tRNA dimethylallyltransferase